MSLSPGFNSGLLDCISLQESIQVLLVTPPPTVVVEGDLRGGNIADDWKAPIWQPHRPTHGRTAEQLRLAEDRLRQCQSTTGRPDGGRISNFCLNLNNVRHGVPPSLKQVGNSWAGQRISLSITRSGKAHAAHLDTERHGAFSPSSGALPSYANGTTLYDSF